MRCLAYLFCMGLALGLWACGIKGPLRPASKPKAKIEASTPVAPPQNPEEGEGVIEEQLHFEEESP
ncbi:MAG: lipoprotein [Cystobacterineae bacterium]|nr:lipoprotein [Cystobacterineae bacterium]